MAALRIPLASYRLQFNRNFRFVDAWVLVPYLHDLGITDLYASPIFEARPGSAHGYDITDPTRLNPELGTEKDFDELAAELQRHDMGLLLDIVPNHMAASVDNPWWADVLEHGRSSPYARYFDIDWGAHPEGRLVLPILGAPVDTVLRWGELTVSLGRSGPYVRYHDTRLPLSSTTSAEVHRANRDPAHMSALLAQQHYELAYWRDGVQRLNYRRFFDISDLIGVRVEDPAAFQAMHELIVRLAREGKVTGLRVDHIDGLRDPLGYLRRLQEALARNGSRLYVLVEKILLGDEILPEEWPTSGTTGYEYANLVNDLFIDARGLERLDVTYRRFAHSQAGFSQVVYEQKKKVMQELFAGEMRDLGRRLARLAEEEQGGGRKGEEHTQALMEVSACLPVYRTYTRSFDMSADDRAYIEGAVKEASRRHPALNAHALDFVRRVLLLDLPPSILPRERQRWLDFVMRWQQFTGPVTAKGLEDTALYNYPRLVSLNEVGGDPGGARVSHAVERFHRHNAETLARRRHTLNATSTHDTKRSEDVRARINVLSEMPVTWARRLNRWSRLNKGKKPFVNGRSVPDPNEEILLYQTLVGAWPLDAGEVPEFARRLSAFVVKAAREAKVNTNWLHPNEPYENALASFTKTILDDSAPNTFLEDLLRLQESIAYYGALNSLAQTLLKIASPGVPDFFQGSEPWDFSLVDPDNRRPVDFTKRANMIRELQRVQVCDTANLVRDLMAHWNDGRIKMYLTTKALRFRKTHAVVFQRGDYVPLRASGDKRENIVAFARNHASDWALLAVPRLFQRLGRPGYPPIGRRAWKDTLLLLPPDAPERWSDVLTGRSLNASAVRKGTALELAEIFHHLPMALLSGVSR
jgi:(1->4)-alpha-D-glucan 1-alpha-D-glucosylmutase